MQLFWGKGKMLSHFLQFQPARSFFLSYQTGHSTLYCRPSHGVPILCLWFNVEAELQQDFCLSRRAMQGLQRLLQREQDDGWGY